MKIRMYTDGGARGNPGPAGAGAVLLAFDDGEEGEVLAEVAEYLGETTNNQAEYMAVILGLQRARDLKADDVDVVMDSELAVKQLNGEYRVKNEEIAKRYVEIHNLKPHFKQLRFSHVRREGNKHADALVNKAIDEALSKNV